MHVIIESLRRRALYVAGLVIALLAIGGRLPGPAQRPAVAAADIQVSLDQFVDYIDTWSEEEGYFDSDNFISNETSYLHVIDELRDQVRPGGVYVGVGPDQNFSYIVHTQPSLAIIFDIRRQNMLQHLMYKALFEMASSRAEFLSLLLSRDTPDVEAGASLPELLTAVRESAASSAHYESNLAAIREILTGYGLHLNEDDFEKIAYVYRTFYEQGLDLRFSSIGRGNSLRYPTFEALLLERDLSNRMQNFLATDELFFWLKKFQSENRLIPVVGHFEGSHAFRTAADFLNRHGMQVSAFYTSNVEFYLFGRPVWPLYVNNVRALPMAPDAVFIRAYFSSSGPPHPRSMPGHRSTSLVQDVESFLSSYAAGRIRSYWDVVRQ